MLIVTTAATLSREQLQRSGVVAQRRAPRPRARSGPRASRTRGRRRRARCARSARRRSTATPSRFSARDRAHHVLHDLGRQALARLVEQHEARARRPARARSTPSASRRRTGSRIRAAAGTRSAGKISQHSRRCPGAKARLLARDARGCAPPSASGRCGGRPAPSRCPRAAMRCVGQLRDVAAVEARCVPRRARREAEDRAQRRRLAGAVRAEQRHHFARRARRSDTPNSTCVSP